MLRNSSSITTILTKAGAVYAKNLCQKRDGLISLNGDQMFGFFKKKDADKDRVNLAIRQEFDQTIAAARVAPLSKQARVGKGIVDALSDFDRKYTKESFQEKSFPERKEFLDSLAKKQEELRLKGGDISIEHIGYSLVSRWVIAVAMGDNQLVKHFDDHMAYFKRAAQSL